MKVKLVVDGLEVQVGTQFLQKLVDAIPDTEDYSDLFLVLAKSQNPNVRRDVACKDKMNTETAELLLSDNEPIVLDQIIAIDAAKAIVTKERLAEILGFAGNEVATTITGNINEYENVNSDELADLILKLDNPSLTLALAEGWRTPKKILKKLLKSNDPDIKTAAQNNLD